ncbi:MAG TPA: hypothetical protein PLK31_21760, partial [Chloroflexota bacterium]|nr:hypothetical protein [Chloroflexota bacterium]
GDLDSVTSQEIIELMRRLNQENGQTFVIVTHSLEIGEQCDRIIWMKDGQIVTEPQHAPANGKANGSTNGQSNGRYHEPIGEPELILVTN